MDSHQSGSGFGTLWAATVTSNLGDGIVLVATPLLAADLIQDPVLVAGVPHCDSVSWWTLLGRCVTTTRNTLNLRPSAAIVLMIREARPPEGGTRLCASSSTMNTG
jgi:hypothetical protein